MKRSKFYAMALLMSTALFTTTSCDSSDDTETTGPVVCPTDQTTTTILEASINKAFPLFAAVDAATKANENFTISPLSLSEMIVMASNGANGDTRKQINSIIGANDNISKESLNEAFNGLNEYLAKVVDKTTFATAISVWIDEGFNVKPEFLSDKKLIGEMLGFSGWNFFGVMTGVMRGQGINMLLNVYCGPAVNAARGLALQVDKAVTKFASNFMTAVRPQITKNYAMGNRAEYERLTMTSSKLAFLMLMNAQVIVAKSELPSR